MDRPALRRIAGLLLLIEALCLAIALIIKSAMTVFLIDLVFVALLPSLGLWLLGNSKPPRKSFGEILGWLLIAFGVYSIVWRVLHGGL
jgi:hypothetical protein